MISSISNLSLLLPKSVSFTQVSLLDPRPLAVHLSGYKYSLLQFSTFGYDCSVLPSETAFGEQKTQLVKEFTKTRTNRKEFIRNENATLQGTSSEFQKRLASLRKVESF